MRGIMIAALVLSLAACANDAPQVVGTLEYDRVALPSPSAERIVSVDVREGQAVAAGQVLLRLDDTRTRAQFAAAEAQARRARDRLEELVAGPRVEAISQARAALASAQARAREARAYLARIEPLKSRNHVAAADLDRARAAADEADAGERAARAALDELLHGTRSEQVAQAAADVAAAEAEVAAQRVLLDKLSVVAPRAGRVDSLPYRLGDQAPVGAPLAILMAGDVPYARVYVPQPLRLGVKVGDAVRVFVGDDGKPHPGTVRAIRSEPSFTPYYALLGADVSRLSWLAEIELGADAADLPAGLPLRVELGGRAK